jgi:hypothetical protein
MNKSPPLDDAAKPMALLRHKGSYNGALSITIQKIFDLRGTSKELTAHALDRPL